MRGVEGGRDEGHARKRALGEEAAGFIDDEEAAIADEAEGVDFSGGDGAAAEGFDGIEEEAGEVHCFGLIANQQTEGRKAKSTPVLQRPLPRG